MKNGIAPVMTIMLVAVSCFAQKYKVTDPPLVPDAKMTPGAVMNVTIEKITRRGYANVLNGGARHVPESEKKAIFIQYFGVVPEHPGQFEIDHLISIELGGDNSANNLWPQSYLTKTWNSHVKDKLENRLAANLRRCFKAQGHAAATKLMRQYQGEISSSWTNAYVKYLGAPK